MKRHIPLLLILSSGLLTACVLISRPTVTVPPPEPWAPGATATLHPTVTAAPPTMTAAPATVTTVPPTETPVVTGATPTIANPTPPAPPAESYIIAQEHVLGEYVVRLWHNPSPESIGFDGIATISRGGEQVVRVEQAAQIASETGSDLTGEGNPDAVIQVYTGGAHCCSSTLVYDLGHEMRLVLESPLSNCGGSFRDLTGDGRPEFVTCDDLFAYTYCSYAASPAVQVIMAYEPGRGYVPASPRFASWYEEMIAEHRTRAQNSTSGEMGEWDGTNKCSVLPLILDYLYTDRPLEAQTALQTFYPHPDATLLWAEIVQMVSRSPLYVLGTQPVQVPGPAYYMLQLLTSCGSDQQYVGLLTEGQAACGSGVPRRDIVWLSWQLGEIGLIGSQETLLLGPEGCTTECSLDIVRLSDNVRQGSIRLDTQIGYPGAVYRVDDTTSEHWRLRGNLTWERMAE